MEDKLVKKLIASIKCGSCGRYYHEDSIEIIERSEDLWFLQVRCPSCEVRCLVAAIIKGDENPEIITDLTGEELKKFHHSGKVKADDMLDMHLFLRDFDGDFPRIFRSG